MPSTTRRFPIPPAALLLLAAPFGCNSDAPGHAQAGDGAGARSAPSRRTETIPPPRVAGPESGEAGGQGQPGLAVREIHQEVLRTAGAVEDGFGDLRGGVSRAVGEARGEVQGLADEARAEAEQASATVEGGVRSTIDQVVGGVQEEVEGAKGDVRRRARTIRDDVEQSARGLKKNVVDGLFGPSEE